MELNCTIASLFLFQSFMWGNNITSFAPNYAYHSKDSNSDCTTRPPHIDSFVTQENALFVHTFGYMCLS